MLHGHSGARMTMQYTLYLYAEQSLTQIMYNDLIVYGLLSH